MSLLTASRTAQTVLESEFTFTFDDTMVDTTGGTADFGVAAAAVVEIIPMPPGSTVVGGSVDFSTAFTAAAAIDIGDATTDDRYYSGAAVGDTLSTVALVPTGHLNVTGENIQMTITPAGPQSVGVATVRVQYVVEGRSCEVQIA